MSMTESEALEVFNSGCNDIYKVQVATHTAIKALEEIQQCRAIGTLEEFRELKEKATAKKPLYRQGSRYKWIDTVREHGRYHGVEKYSNRDACPNCKKDILKIPYCEHCGQKIDWSEGKG